MKKILFFLLTINLFVSASRIEDDVENPDKCYVCNDYLNNEQPLIVGCDQHKAHKDCWSSYIQKTKIGEKKDSVACVVRGAQS